MEHPGVSDHVRGSEHPGALSILKALEHPGAFGASWGSGASRESSEYPQEYSQELWNIPGTGVMEHAEAFGGFWSILGSSEHPGALQYPGGSRASWGAQILSPVGAPRSIPGPAEHPKLLGTPRTPGNTLDSREHPSSSCVALRSSLSPLDPPGSSEQLGPLRDPQTPGSPWSPLEHPELSGAPQGVPELARLPPTAPTAGVVPPIRTPPAPRKGWKVQEGVS